MLNTFPSLLSLAIFVPFAFRIAVALFLVEIVVNLKRHRAAFASYYVENGYPLARTIPVLHQVFAGACALLLVLGFLTQITSIMSAFVILAVGRANRYARTFRHSESTFTFVAIIAFSLIFLGAGAFAFDIPL